MTVYEGVFSAKIIHPDSKDSNYLRFNLRGEGILPTIKISSGSLVDNNLSFGRVKLNDSSLQTLTALNYGSIPATIACNFPNSNNFRIVNESEMSLLPGESHGFQIEFNPKEQKKISHQIHFLTEQNTFEKSVVNLVGEGYFEELSFEQISDDLVSLGEIIFVPGLAVLSKKYFELRNFSNETFRFSFSPKSGAAGVVSVSPQIGHVSPKMSKKIKVEALGRDKTDMVQILHQFICSS